MTEENGKCEFIVNRDKFRAFIKAVRCKGISTITVSDKSTSIEKDSFFENFLINATPEGDIVITATDTKAGKVTAGHCFKGGENLKVLKAGKIPVVYPDRFLVALDRVGGAKKGADVSISFPDEENKILFHRTSLDTGFNIPTGDEGKITSLANINTIKHAWSREFSCVIGKSATKNSDVPWPHRVMVVPSALREVAADVEKLVRRSVTTLKITGNKMLLHLGDDKSSSKGSREIEKVTRKVAKFENEKPKSGWSNLKSLVWEDISNDTEDIEANYYHGFYAVLQSLDDTLSTEIHFINLFGGWIAWVHGENVDIELNYMIPFDKNKV
jgi:hypothetical protein